MNGTEGLFLFAVINGRKKKKKTEEEKQKGRKETVRAACQRLASLTWLDQYPRALPDSERVCKGLWTAAWPVSGIKEVDHFQQERRLAELLPVNKTTLTNHKHSLACYDLSPSG